MGMDAETGATAARRRLMAVARDTALPPTALRIAMVVGWMSVQGEGMTANGWVRADRANLAATLGVSKRSVGEALRLLTRHGHLEARAVRHGDVWEGHRYPRRAYRLALLASAQLATA